MSSTTPTNLSFVPYQHVERFGTKSVKNIQCGKCYIFPKLDGTNASVWLSADGKVCAGSRKRELTLEKDNAFFFKWVTDNKEKFHSFFNKYPQLRLYGEWLVPNAIKYYRKDAWRKFYIFDVFNENTGKYTPFEEYHKICVDAGFDVVPLLSIIENPVFNDIIPFLKNNTYLIDETSGNVGEGIVIKRYNFENVYGRVQWAKIISDEFKHQKGEHRNNKNGKVKENVLESKFVDKYATDSFLNKCFAKETLNSEWEVKRTAHFIHFVYEELITEELAEYVLGLKCPTIDFKVVKNLLAVRAKKCIDNNLNNLNN